jgi:hypothetical protein
VAVNPTKSRALHFALLAVLLVLGGLGFAAWVTDWVTMEGEHTIYTVACGQGEWHDLRCTGRLVAAERYRFRASKSRNEVVYWIAGSSAPSGRYADCKVANRNNWSCKVNADERGTIVYALAKGQPVPGAPHGDIAFRAVAKWKWWALRLGIPGLTSADFGSDAALVVPPTSAAEKSAK